MKVLSVTVEDDELLIALEAAQDMFINVIVGSDRKTTTVTFEVQDQVECSGKTPEEAMEQFSKSLNTIAHQLDTMKPTIHNLISMPW